MSDTIWVAIITLIASVGSTSIAQFIRNKHDEKMKTIDLQSTVKKDAINNFIDSTLNCDLPNFDNVEFYKSLNKLVPYVDETSSKYVGKIKKMVEDGFNIKQINSELLKLTIYLSGKDNIKSIK